MSAQINCSRWHRKSWHPWGKTIGWHDEKFVTIEGEWGAARICRHFCHSRSGSMPSRHVKFYVFVDRHHYIHRSRCLSELVDMAAEELIAWQKENRNKPFYRDLKRLSRKSRKQTARAKA